MRCYQCDYAPGMVSLSRVERTRTRPRIRYDKDLKEFICSNCDPLWDRELDLIEAEEYNPLWPAIVEENEDIGDITKG